MCFIIFQDPVEDEEEEEEEELVVGYTYVYPIYIYTSKLVYYCIANCLLS